MPEVNGYQAVVIVDGTGTAQSPTALGTTTNPIAIAARPQTSGGLSVGMIKTGTTGFIKATPGQVYGLAAQNANAAVRYLHLYNKASAPTLNSDTAFMTIPLSASSTTNLVLTDLGVPFSTGIAWAFTTDDVAVPVTAGASGELHATIFYA